MSPNNPYLLSDCPRSHRLQLHQISNQHSLRLCNSKHLKYSIEASWRQQGPACCVTLSTSSPVLLFPVPWFIYVEQLQDKQAEERQRARKTCHAVTVTLRCAIFPLPQKNQFLMNRCKKKNRNHFQPCGDNSSEDSLETTQSVTYN